MIHNWTTTHDTSNQIMTHHFCHGVKVIVEWAKNTITVSRDGEVIDKYTIDADYTSRRHLEMLIRTSNSVNLMEKWNQ